MTLPFVQQLDTLPDSPAWLAALRGEAADTYRASGLPTQRHEGWKYTNIAPVFADPLMLSSRGMTTGSNPKGDSHLDPAIKSRDDNSAWLLPDAMHYMFVDGVFDAGQSSPVGHEGLICGPWQATGAEGLIGNAPLLKQQAIASLNLALFEDAFVLAVPPNYPAETPIEVCFMGKGHVRLAITLAANASATLIERHAGSGMRSVVSEITLGDGARLDHFRLLQGEADAVTLATGAVTIGRDATYNAFALTIGSRLSRHEIRAELAAPGGTVHLNGAHVLAGDSHADTTTEIVHAAPHCSSRETYRHVMDGSARSVFQGKIYVAEGAQKTDGFQLNQSLMLSPHAEVDAKPELEIYADDVKCSHGATSGRLDTEALFYLRSRGIPEAEARSMLVDAFIGSAIDLIEHEQLREEFRNAARRPEAL